MHRMEVCKRQPTSAMAQRKKTEENLRSPLAPSERNNAPPLQHKSGAREISSKYKYGISPLTIPPPGSPKRSQSTERRRPATLNHRASPPCSPSRTIPSRTSTPVHDVTGEILQLSNRKQTSGRTPDGLWPSMRSLSASFRSVSRTRACPEDPQLGKRTQALTTSRSVDFRDRLVNKPKRTLSSTSTEIPRSEMEYQFMSNAVPSRPTRTLSVPSGGSFCSSPASCRRSSTAGIQSSVRSYFTGLRKGKQRAGQLEDVHQLRMLENRYLQWRFVNARAQTAMDIQKITAKVGCSVFLYILNDQ